MSQIKIPNELTIEQRRKYFHANDQMAKYFGQEMVDRELSKLRVEDLLELIEMPYKLDQYGHPIKTAALAGSWNYMGEEWRHIDGGPKKLCQVYLSSNRHQSVRHPEMLEAMVVDTWPFMAEFKFATYSMANEKEPELYVKFAKPLSIEGKRYTWDSVYVPYKALLENDFSIIEKRNQSYIKEYNGIEQLWVDVQNTPEYKRLAIAFNTGLDPSKSVVLTRKLNGAALDHVVTEITGKNAEDPVSMMRMCEILASSGFSIEPNDGGYSAKVTGQQAFYDNDQMVATKRALVSVVYGNRVIVPAELIDPETKPKMKM